MLRELIRTDRQDRNNFLFRRSDRLLLRLPWHRIYARLFVLGILTKRFWNSVLKFNGIDPWHGRIFKELEGKESIQREFERKMGSHLLVRDDHSLFLRSWFDGRKLLPMYSQFGCSNIFCNRLCVDYSRHNSWINSFQIRIHVGHGNGNGLYQPVQFTRNWQKGW